MSWRSLASLCLHKDTIENGIRPYTIKSHGIKVAKKHILDWLILVVLVVTEIILNAITPFRCYVGKDTIDDLKYPIKSSTVPLWAVPLYAVVLPVIVFIIRYLRRRDVHDLHHAILGLLYAVLITGIITDTVKDAVGLPRPDFFWRCFPDGQDKYDNLGNVICNGDPSAIMEGYKSFPSGHASWSFAGLGYLALYMTGKIQVFDTRGRVASLCLVLLPLLVATLVAISRVDDYVHRWTDVFAGALIGLVSSFLCYLLFFPLPYRNKGWGPYSYFVALEEATREADGTPMNVVNATTAGSSDIFMSMEHEKDHKITIDG